MVKLRLTRVGKKKQPSYRLVAANSRAPRDGRFIEILGHYNPMVEPATLVLVEPHGPAVGLDKASHDREAEAGPRVGPPLAPEPVEGVFAELRGQPGAPVRDLDLGEVGVGLDHDADLRSRG